MSLLSLLKIEGYTHILYIFFLLDNSFGAVATEQLQVGLVWGDMGANWQ